MRTVDDIASDFANASTDTERATLIREMDAMRGEARSVARRNGFRVPRGLAVEVEC